MFFFFVVVIWTSNLICFPQLEQRHSTPIHFYNKRFLFHCSPVSEIHSTKSINFVDEHFRCAKSEYYIRVNKQQWNDGNACLLTTAVYMLSRCLPRFNYYIKFVHTCCTLLAATIHSYLLNKPIWFRCVAISFSTLAVCRYPVCACVFLWLDMRHPIWILYT